MTNAELAQKAREALASRLYKALWAPMKWENADALQRGAYLGEADAILALTWHDIDPSLPKVRVVVFQHPDQTLPTREPDIIEEVSYDDGWQDCADEMIGWVRTVSEEE